MRPLIIPIETVRLQTIRSNTSIRPARANGSKRVRWVFVHSKHLEVPNAKFDLHLPQRRPEHSCAHCSSAWSSCSQSEVGLQKSRGQLSCSIVVLFLFGCKLIHTDLVFVPVVLHQICSRMDLSLSTVERTHTVQ